MLNDVLASHIPSRRFWEHEEHRQACNKVWPVKAGRVIFNYQNPICGITIEIYDIVLRNIRYRFKYNHNEPYRLWRQDSSWPLWCMWLLDVGSSNFTQTTVRSNHYGFTPKSVKSCYNRPQRVKSSHGNSYEDQVVIRPIGMCQHLIQDGWQKLHDKVQVYLGEMFLQ